MNIETLFPKARANEFKKIYTPLQKSTYDEMKTALMKLSQKVGRKVTVEEFAEKAVTELTRRILDNV